MRLINLLSLFETKMNMEINKVEKMYSIQEER